MTCLASLSSPCVWQAHNADIFGVTQQHLHKRRSAGAEAGEVVLTQHVTAAGLSAYQPLSSCMTLPMLPSCWGVERYKAKACLCQLCLRSVALQPSVHRQLAAMLTYVLPMQGQLNSSRLKTRILGPCRYSTSQSHRKHACPQHQQDCPPHAMISAQPVAIGHCSCSRMPGNGHSPSTSHSPS